MQKKQFTVQQKLSNNVEKLLYILVFTMVFEGLFRKLLPVAVGIIIFFAKDMLCIAGLVFINKSVQKNKLVMGWKLYFLACIPLLINTLFRDPILVVFSLKQYFLYTVVALLMPIAFTAEKMLNFKRFIIISSLLVIPTTLIAVLQNALPATHWLNLSVDGGSLEQFSSGGVLRVSSTFSFTGQYGWFLNFITAMLVAAILLPLNFKNSLLRLAKKVMPAVLGFAFICGAFITGGRTAVIGCGAILAVGFLLATIKAPQTFLFRGILVVVVLMVSLSVTRVVFPQLFYVYERRSAGTEDESHSEELEERVFGNVTGWTNWIADQDLIGFMFGSGLGVMSNGVDKISSYAKDIRANGFWTEDDIATAAWEGGIYFVVVWYGFRIWVIRRCLLMWRAVNQKTHGLVISFLLAHVIINGLYGTLSTQPPIAIWFWMSVGAINVLYNMNVIAPKFKNFPNIKESV